MVGPPWGPRRPEPFYDRSIKIYAMSLQKGLRSPFEPADELHPDKPEAKPASDAAKKDEKAPSEKPGDKPAEKPPEKVKVDIDLDGLGARIQEVPLPPGNYSQLAVAGSRLCWVDRSSAEPEKAMLQCADINNKGDKPETVMEEINGFEVSADGKKIMIVKKAEVLVID